MNSVGSIIMYVIIALSMIVFSVLTVTSRKILRAATFLLFTLFAAAAMYFMLGYEFLGAVQIAVYAGGIVVLFVFSILLTTKPGDNTEKLKSRSRVMGLLAALAMGGVTLFALLSRAGQLLVSQSMPAMETPTMKELGHTLMSTGEGGLLLPFEAISVLLLACIIGGVVIARKR